MAYFMKCNQGTQEMDQQWINLPNCILPGLGIVAPRGANFFHIIILYYFHGGSRTFVFIQARLNPAPVNRIICDLFSQDNNKGLCSLCG